MQNRSRESSLYYWLSEGKPTEMFMERVENAIARGTPDVFGVLGNAFTLELKSVQVRPNGRVWCELRSEQASFARRWAAAGGRSFVLVQVGAGRDARRYLVPARGLLPLLQETTVEYLTSASVCDPLDSANNILRRCAI